MAGFRAGELFISTGAAEAAAGNNMTIAARRKIGSERFMAKTPFQGGYD
jgi:hypothetical protein